MDSGVIFVGRATRPLRSCYHLYRFFSHIYAELLFLFYFIWLHFNPLPISYDILLRYILWRMVSFSCILWIYLSTILLTYYPHPLCISRNLSTGMFLCFVDILKILLHILLDFRVFRGTNLGQNRYFYNPVSSLYSAIRASGCFDFVFCVLSLWPFVYYHEYQFAFFAC